MYIDIRLWYKSPSHRFVDCQAQRALRHELKKQKRELSAEREAKRAKRAPRGKGQAKGRGKGKGRGKNVDNKEAKEQEEAPEIELSDGNGGPGETYSMEAGLEKTDANMKAEREKEEAAGEPSAKRRKRQLRQTPDIQDDESKEKLEPAPSSGSVAPVEEMRANNESKSKTSSKDHDQENKNTLNSKHPPISYINVNPDLFFFIQDARKKKAQQSREVHCLLPSSIYD